VSQLTTTPLKSAPSAAGGVALTHGTMPTYGPWIELIASTAVPIAIAGVQWTGGSYSAVWWELDIGVGAAGAEVSVGTLRQFLYNSGSIATPVGILLPVPLGGIGSGVRVAVRSRATSAGSGPTTLSLQYYENLSSDQVTTSSQILSSAPSGSGTASLTPSATPWANSAWVELVASASSDLGLLGLVHGEDIGAELGVEFDLGTGASGAETVITTLRQTRTVGRAPRTWLPGLYPITAGTRVAVRVRKAGTSTTALPIAVLYYTNVSSAPSPVTGTGAVSFGVVALDGSGDVTAPLVGTGGVTFSVPTLAGSGGAVVPLRVTQLVAELVQSRPASARVTQLVVEVLRTIPSPEAVFLDGRVSYPLCWLEYTDRVGDRHVFAEVDLNDRVSYYGGYKAPWVVEFRAITRGISDPTGQLEHLAFGARLSDTTRFFRGQLADPARRYVANRPLVERMIDDEDRRAERTPRIVAVGYAKSPQVLPSLQVELPGTDWIAKKFIRKQRQEEDWIARVTAADFPTAPPQVLDQTIPILYGEVSDETDTGTTLSAPTNLHAAVFGTATDPVTRRFYVTGLTGEFGVYQGSDDHRGETDAAWIDVAGCPSDAELDQQEATGTVHVYVEINWDCPGAAGCRVYRNQNGSAAQLISGADYGPGFPPAVTPGDPFRSWGYIPDTNPNAQFFYLDGQRPYGLAESNSYKGGGPPLTNATGPGDTGSGLVPVIAVGPVTLGGLVRHQFLVTACALASIRSVYAGGVRLTDAQRDASFRVPGTALWASEIDAARTYVDLNGHRYTIIYGLAGDAVADAAASGTTPLTLNAWGIEDIGDGTGALIRLLALQEQHFARNYLAAEPSYRGGDWLTVAPQFPEPSGLTLMDEESFETTAAAFPVEGAGMLGVNNQSITGTNALGSFHVSGDWEAFFNRRGQLALTREPDEAPATALTLTDVVHVSADSFRITDQYDRFANILPYTHTRDYAGLHQANGGWLSGDLILADATSAAGYEQERRSSPWALEWLRAPLAAAEITEVMTRKLARTTNPLREARLSLSYEGLSLEVGDVFRFTHAEGIGAEGWVNRWVRVTRHEVQPSEGIVTLEVYDLELVWAARLELSASGSRSERIRP